MIKEILARELRPDSEFKGKGQKPPASERNVPTQDPKFTTLITPNEIDHRRNLNSGNENRLENSDRSKISLPLVNMKRKSEATN